MHSGEAVGHENSCVWSYLHCLGSFPRGEIWSESMIKTHPLRILIILSKGFWISHVLTCISPQTCQGKETVPTFYIHIVLPFIALTSLISYTLSLYWKNCLALCGFFCLVFCLNHCTIDISCVSYAFVSLSISESLLWGFPSSDLLNIIIPLPQIMLAALNKILSSLALG